MPHMHPMLGMRRRLALGISHPHQDVARHTDHAHTPGEVAGI